ncbi:hypothetical protein LguiA_016920 [Lonicera macranthoides]
MGEIYSNRSREFRFEHKRFSFEVDNGGSMGIITETNRQRSYTIRIDFGGMFWLMEGLYSAARGSGESKFFQKYQASYGLFIMEKFSNKNGSFIRLLELQRGMVSNTIIFPAGNRGEGWRGVADRLKQMMFSPTPYPKYVPVKNARVQVLNDNMSGRGGNKLHCSYAEALKLRAISKLRWDRVPAEDPLPINMFAEEDIVVVDTKNDEDDILTSFGKVEGGNHGVKAETEPEQMKPGKALSEGHEGNWLGRIKAKKIEDFKVWEIKRRKTITQPRSRCITGSCVLRCENDDIESVKFFCDKEGQNNFSDSESEIRKTPKEGTKERKNRDSAESGELKDKRFGQIYTRKSNKKLIREIENTTEIPECFEQAIDDFFGTEAENLGNIISDFSENESQEDEDRESSSSEVVKESNEVEAVCEVGNFFDMYEVDSIANQDQGIWGG